MKAKDIKQSKKEKVLSVFKKMVGNYIKLCNIRKILNEAVSQDSVISFDDVTNDFKLNPPPMSSL